MEKTSELNSLGTAFDQKYQKDRKYSHRDRRNLDKFYIQNKQEFELLIEQINDPIIESFRKKRNKWVIDKQAAERAKQVVEWIQNVARE